MSTRISALLSALILCLTFVGANAFAEDTPTLKVGSKVARRAQVVVQRRVGQVNINTASATELSSLKGIGKKKAMLIIKDREANGPFATPQDLTRIKGIGKKTVEKNLDRISTGAAESSDAAKPAARGKAKRKMMRKMKRKLVNAPSSVKGSTKPKTMKRRNINKAKKMDHNKVD